MLKIKPNIRQEVFDFMNKNPATANKDIVKNFPDYSENSVKTYRTQWLKAHKKRLPRTKDELLNNKSMTLEEIEKHLKENVYNKIDAETIEKSLLELINAGLITPNVVRSMIDFFIKIGNKKDVIDEDLDMEVLKSIGIKISNS